MIELLRQQIAGVETNEGKINRLREALQLLCLKILQDKGYFSNIAFVGGTALRILYDMRRFSEDMDFSVIDKKGYDFTNLAFTVKRELELNNLKVNIKPKIAKTVQSCMLKFPGMMKNVGLLANENQNLSIKIEADSNPPAGWHAESTIVNKLYMLNITHFGITSLYATKLHACFFRKFVKGRDFYDLLWYLGKKIKPNYELLNNAIAQTQGKSPALDNGNIKEFLLEKVAKIDFNGIVKDVERFLEDKSELRLLDRAVISKSIADVF